MPQKSQSLGGGKLAQSRNNQGKLSKRNEQARFETDKLQEEMDDNGWKIQEEAQNEVDLELETRELRAGEGRRGNSASQSTNRCCFDPTLSGANGGRRVSAAMAAVINHLR